MLNIMACKMAEEAGLEKSLFAQKYKDVISSLSRVMGRCSRNQFCLPTLRQLAGLGVFVVCLGARFEREGGTALSPPGREDALHLALHAFVRILEEQAAAQPLIRVAKAGVAVAADPAAGLLHRPLACEPLAEEEGQAGGAAVVEAAHQSVVRHQHQVGLAQRPQPLQVAHVHEDVQLMRCVLLGLICSVLNLNDD